MRETAIYFCVREKHLCTENYWEWVQESFPKRALQDSGIHPIFSSLSWICYERLSLFSNRNQLRMCITSLNVFKFGTKTISSN